MPDQIPEGCAPLQTLLDQLTAEWNGLKDGLQEALLDAGNNPSARARVMSRLNAAEAAVTTAENNLKNCIDNPPPVKGWPPVKDPIPGMPAVCIPFQTQVDTLTLRWQQLQQALADADPSEKTQIRNLLGAAEFAMLDAKNRLKACLDQNSDPVFSIPPPATIPTNINTDATLQEVDQIIPWSALKKKFDKLFNKRTDPPVFNIRLDNTLNFGEQQPTSTVTISMIEPYVDNGQVTPYDTITTIDLGQLSSGYYFNDINSNNITVSLDPSAPEPLTLKISFECDGLDEMPSTSSLFPNMKFKEFYISLRLTLGFDAANRRVDLLSWITDFNNLKVTRIYSTVNLSGKFLGQTVNQTITDLEYDSGSYKDFFVQQIVLVHIVTTEATDLGGATQISMRGKIFDYLMGKDKDGKYVKDSINSQVNKWILGGDGSYNVTCFNNDDVTCFNNDGQTVTIKYLVPQSTLDPFPDKPEGWPNPTDATLDPKFNFPIPANLANIEHIVVLTMENRSFDHMLGYLSLPVSAGGMGRTEVDGLKGGEFNPYDLVSYPSYPFAAGDTQFAPDPPHSYEPVHGQINDGKMNGFVKAFALKYPGIPVSSYGEIMGYHTAVNVPVYDALVRDFGISDRWFAPHPGPTFSNRFYELTGRLNLASGLNTDTPPIAKDTWEFSNSSPLTPVFNKSIFDYLTDYNKTIDSSVTWKYYEDNYCFLRFFSKYTFDDTNVVAIDDPQNGFFADAKNGTLPSVSFIDPHFIELPPNANCDGPVADIKAGQTLVQKIVETVVASPQFANTLLIITYDEHGGFYDHVPPFEAKPFADDFPIKTYGVRVPAFFVSPWVKAGSVSGHNGAEEIIHFDHTSILKTIATRFMSKNPPYMGARYADAKDLSAVLDVTSRTPQFLPFIRYNFLYNSFAKSLDVPGGSPAPGAMLWLYDINNTDAQHFSFEDAGDGFFYIRTHPGNLYVTVAVTADDATTDHGIKQDVKMHASNINNVTIYNNPAYQKWKLTAWGSGAELNNYSFVITNAFFTNKVLKPLGNVTGATMVLGDPDPTNTLSTNQNTWKITSACL